MAIQNCIGRKLVLVPAFSIFLVLLFACNHESNGLSSKKDEIAIDENSGKRIFEKNCTACHGCDGQAGLSGAKDLSISTLTEEEMKEVILNGRNAMPPFNHILNDSQSIEKTIEHIKTLKK